MEPGATIQPEETGPGTTEDGRSSDGTSVESRAIAAIGYLPLLFLVPLLAGRGDEHQRFHGRQSLLLFLTFALLWAAIWFLVLVFGRILGDAILLGFFFRALAWFLRSIVGTLLSLGYIAMMILGIVHAVSGRCWVMPFLGRYGVRNSNP